MTTYASYDNTNQCGTVIIEITQYPGSGSWNVGTTTSNPAISGAAAFCYCTPFPTEGVVEDNFNLGTPGATDTVVVTWMSGPGNAYSTSDGSILHQETLNLTAGSSPPAAPDAATGLTVVNNGSGVTLSWTAPDTGATFYGVYRDGSFVKNVSGTSTTDTASGAHSYYVVAVNNSACGATNGSASAPVSTAVAPNAPGWVSPTSGSVINAGADNGFAWSFSSGMYGDNQTGFDISWSGDAGTTWSTPIHRTSGGYTLPAGTLTAGSWQFRVRVYGSSGLMSSWSSTLALTVAAAPSGPTITSPLAGATVGTTATITWTASSQAAYEVRRVADLEDGDPDSTNVYWDSGEITGTPGTNDRSLTVNFDTNLRYEHVQVRIEVSGIWSEWSDVRINVSYPTPPVPTFEVDPVVDPLMPADPLNPNPTPSCMQITWATPAKSGAQVDAVSVTVQASRDGGMTVEWSRSNQALAATVLFRTPASGHDYLIQVLAVAATGATASSGWT